MSGISRAKKRADARAVVCPKCAAPVYEACVKTNGERSISIHRERHAEARRESAVREEQAAQTARCESPIETMMLYALQGTDLGGAEVVSQAEIGKYRVDFLVRTNACSFVIECDGHDTHHSSKQVVQRDRIRERYLQKTGYLVIRFAGTEIVSDPFGCALEIRSIMSAWGAL